MPYIAAHVRSWLFVLGMLLAGKCLTGFETLGAEASAVCARWHITETANLRILNYGLQPVRRETATACEAARDRLAQQWLDPSRIPAWRPKCDIVLHSTDASYLREVGGGARSTAASALVERRGGRIVLRRVDVRASRADWLTAALAHELTHVVLADRFAEGALPRWIDEGMAILADPAAKRERHALGVRRALASGTQFRLPELLSLTDYPPAGRWGVFYDQSATLVDYLVAKAGRAHFVEFVELALEHGYERALAQVYQLNVGELEAHFGRAFSRPGAVKLAADSPPTLRLANSKS